MNSSYLQKWTTSLAVAGLCASGAWAAEQRIQGEVQSVSSSADQISVRTDAGQTRTFNVDSGTRVSVNGTTARISTLSPGDRVTVTIDTDQADSALSIERVAATSGAAGSATMGAAENELRDTQSMSDPAGTTSGSTDSMTRDTAGSDTGTTMSRETTSGTAADADTERSTYDTDSASTARDTSSTGMDTSRTTTGTGTTSTVRDTTATGTSATRRSSSADADTASGAMDTDTTAADTDREDLSPPRSTADADTAGTARGTMDEDAMNEPSMGTSAMDEPGSMAAGELPATSTPAWLLALGGGGLLLLMAAGLRAVRMVRGR